MVAVGTIVWLSSELMFFAALFAMYFTTRAVQGPAIWLESTEILNIPFAAFNTTVLVLSSVTCQFGVFAAERYQARRDGALWKISSWGMREWFSMTFLMGGFFIAGQVYEYAHLVAEGMTLSSTAYGSRRKGSSLYSRSSNNCNRCFLLLALCRCCLDCTLRLYLPH
jgi:cytochrome c oxidase subunit 3